MILNPSCSEEVFRLTGNLEEIKQEVRNMLDCIEKDNQTSEDAEWKKKDAKRIKAKREELNKIKSIDEFKNFCIPFTCNYETFFKKEDDRNILVATCNNVEWDGVEKEEIYEEEGRSYYDIADYHYYDIIEQGEGWTILEHKYTDKEGEDTGKSSIAITSLKLKENENIQLKIIEGVFMMIGNNGLVPLPLVTDKKLLEKVEQMLVERQI